MRLLNEILDAVCAVWPTRRVGVRLSPENGFNSMTDSDPRAHFGYFVEQLSPRGLAYVHVLEGDMMTKSSALDYRALRSKFAGPYTPTTAMTSRAPKRRYVAALLTWWRLEFRFWPTPTWCAVIGRTCR
jgi:2,4-dienoyl-CoA reductase-like NADH-dependent reductase (Old Yellow Enzyme family)